MAIGNEIDPLTFSKEDEANGGYIPMRLGQVDKGLLRKKGRLAGGVRDRFTMAQMKARMASLWRDGANYAVIAERVSDEYHLEGDQRLKANSIHYHIKEMLSYWREKGLVHMDERQAMILARYEQIEMLATEAYFASCEGSKTKNFKKQIDRARSKDREKQILESIKRERKEAREHNKDVNERRAKNGKLRKTRVPFMDDGEILDTLAITHAKTESYIRRESKPAGDPRWLQIMVDINYKRSQLWGLLNKSEMANPDQELARLPDEVREQRMAALLQQAQSRRNKNLGLLAPPSPLGGFKEGEGPIIPEVLPPEEESVDDSVWDIDESTEGEVEWD